MQSTKLQLSRLSTNRGKVRIAIWRVPLERSDTTPTRGEWRRALFHVPPSEMAALKEELRTSGLLSLDGSYAADVFDGVTWSVHPAGGGQSRHVFFGNHFPAPVVHVSGWLRGHVVAPRSEELWRSAERLLNGPDDAFVPTLTRAIRSAPEVPSELVDASSRVLTSAEACATAMLPTRCASARAYEAATATHAAFEQLVRGLEVEDGSRYVVLARAQSAWLAYRDAACSIALLPGPEDTAPRHAREEACRASLDKTRTRELVDALRKRPRPIRHP